MDLQVSPFMNWGTRLRLLDLYGTKRFNEGHVWIWFIRSNEKKLNSRGRGRNPVDLSIWQQLFLFHLPTSQSFSDSGGTGSVNITTQAIVSGQRRAVHPGSRNFRQQRHGEWNGKFISVTPIQCKPEGRDVDHAGRTLGDFTGSVETAFQRNFLSLVRSREVTSGQLGLLLCRPSSGAIDLLVDLYNLSADVDLYVQRESQPTLSTYDCVRGKHRNNQRAMRHQRTPSGRCG